MGSKTKPVTHDRRCKVLVETKTQRALAMRMILHCLLFMIAGGLIAAVHQYLANPFKDSEQLFSSMLDNFYAYSLAFLVLLPPVILDSLKLSNRIVGPICRLESTMGRVARGEDVKPMKFRPGDYWQDIPEEFNTMIASLRTSTSEIEEPEFAAPIA